MTEYDSIPYATRQSLVRYLRDGIDPGSFLYAVLTNNLADAVGRADKENLPALKTIVMFLRNRVPSLCHGSVSDYRRWTRDPELRAECMSYPEGIKALDILNGTFQ
jgi:hypothetical protein